MRFFSFDAASCRDDLSRRLDALKGELQRKGQRLLGSVMFTCGGRTQHFFGEPAFDASTFVKTFSGTPLIGMYAGGEIGPQLLAEAPPSKAFQVGRAQMHGFTVVFGCSSCRSARWRARAAWRTPTTTPSPPRSPSTRACRRRRRRGQRRRRRRAARVERRRAPRALYQGAQGDDGAPRAGRHAGQRRRTSCRRSYRTCRRSERVGGWGGGGGVGGILRGARGTARWRMLSMSWLACRIECGRLRWWLGS